MYTQGSIITGTSIIIRVNEKLSKAIVNEPNHFFHRKLISFYEELTTEFEKVSQFFKFGNLKLFQRDMTNYYTDLQFTKGKVM